LRPWSGVPEKFFTGAELIAAITDGRAYVNIHSTKWPAGEIRKQFPTDHDDDHDDQR
jgi:hypothetical protein